MKKSSIVAWPFCVAMLVHSRSGISDQSPPRPSLELNSVQAGCPKGNMLKAKFLDENGKRSVLREEKPVLASKIGLLCEEKIPSHQYQINPREERINVVLVNEEGKAEKSTCDFIEVSCTDGPILGFKKGNDFKGICPNPTISNYCLGKEILH